RSSSAKASIRDTSIAVRMRPASEKNAAECVTRDSSQPSEKRALVSHCPQGCQPTAALALAHRNRVYSPVVREPYAGLAPPQELLRTAIGDACSARPKLFKLTS